MHSVRPVRRHSVRPVRLLVIPVMATTLALAGCGGSKAPTTAEAPPSATSTSAVVAPTTSDTGAATTATDAGSTQCPTQNTRAFAKTRLVADLGIAAGTFHRYIWKPWQAGSFKKGAHGRVLAIAKAAGTAALDAKLLKNATENIKANPTLCKVLAQPMSELESKLKDFKGQALAGNLGFIGEAEQLVQTIEQKAAASGLGIKETTNTSGS